VSGAPVASTVSEAPRTLPKPASRPGRGVLWAAAVRMISERPLLGVGPDNYRLVYGRYAGLEPFDTRVHSNNMYLEMLASGGALGGAAFLWLCVAVARTTRRGLDGAAGSPIAPLTIGMVAAVAAIAVHGLLDSFLSFTGTYVLIAFVMALVVAASGTSTAHAHRV
jgi:O-antigen ligase